MQELSLKKPKNQKAKFPKNKKRQRNTQKQTEKTKQKPTKKAKTPKITIYLPETKPKMSSFIKTNHITIRRFARARAITE